MDFFTKFLFFELACLLQSGLIDAVEDKILTVKHNKGNDCSAQPQLGALCGGD